MLHSSVHCCPSHRRTAPLKPTSHTFDALDPLSEADLTRTVTIRGEPHSVMQAINRQLAHYPHHVGQIVLLAKHFACDRWQSLSVPRNKSAEFNLRVASGEASQR